MTEPDRKRIGLIADSHGDLAATAKAIRLLRERDADLLIHLGDFCDSVRHDRAAAMIDLLRENDVGAVKGNNDFLVENMLADVRRPRDAEGFRVLAYLRKIPAVRARGDVRFAHSLPSDAFRAFYEPIDRGNTQRAEELFAEADFRILCCGHSHLPVLFRKAGGRVMREAVPMGRAMVLKADERYILVAGAAMDGECALYDEAAGTYERLRTAGSKGR